MGFDVLLICFLFYINNPLLVSIPIVAVTIVNVAVAVAIVAFVVMIVIAVIIDVVVIIIVPTMITVPMINSIALECATISSSFTIAIVVLIELTEGFGILVTLILSNNTKNVSLPIVPGYGSWT